MSDVPKTIMQPAESFVRQAKDALEDLYDFAALERHPFACLIAMQHSLPGETSGQCLRRHLLNAIDALNPGSTLTQHEPQSRSYDLLRLRYVEGMRIQEAADELGISERHAYRHLREAIDALASVLWSRHTDLRQAEAGSDALPQPSIASHDLVLQSIDLRELAAHAVAAVARLAESRGVEVELVEPSDPVIVATEAAMAKQILVSLVSQCIQHSQQSTLAMILAHDDAVVMITICSVLDSNENHTVITPVVDQLARQLGWSLSANTDVDDKQTVHVQISTSVPTLLVIDDEEGLGKLIERYLTDLPLRVVIASSGADGLDRAIKLQPAAILLDVMMPGMDGWEVLQRLRTNPKTRDTSVIVCSIFNDPELAASLGAQKLLPKPLTPAHFFEALSDLGVL